MTWFRAVEGIEWFDMDGVSPDEAARAILKSTGSAGDPARGRDAR